MQQLKVEELEDGKFRENRRLTKRDLKILEFVLEMKFVSIEEVYDKFFKIKKDGTPSKSDWWARDRVFQLRRLGFLKSISFYTEARSFYVATYKAYYLLLGIYTDRHFCRPSSEIDLRTFYHDWLVTKCRLALEEQGLATSWVSEKELRSETGILFGLPKRQMPDGIYRDKSNISWAFELEIALKANSRYREKIRLYEKFMNKGLKTNQKPFDRCLFLCEKETVYEILKRQTLAYGKLFEVRRLFEFVEWTSKKGGEV